MGWTSSTRLLRERAWSALNIVPEEASATSSRIPTAVTELHSISRKASSCNAYFKLVFLTNHRITQPGKAPLQAKQAACPRNPACTTPTNQTSENTLTTHETTFALGRIRSQRICLIPATTGVQYIASPNFCFYAIWRLPLLPNTIDTFRSLGDRLTSLTGRLAWVTCGLLAGYMPGPRVLESQEDIFVPVVCWLGCCAKRLHGR